MSKTISVTEEVFKLLSRMKLPGESFSQTIRRLVRRSRISECAGRWANLSKDELDAMVESIGVLRQRVADEFSGKDEG